MNYVVLAAKDFAFSVVDGAKIKPTDIVQNKVVCNKTVYLNIDCGSGQHCRKLTFFSELIL